MCIQVGYKISKVMVYVRLPNFKTGINPSNASRFNTEIYTGKQITSRSKGKVSNSKAVDGEKQDLG